MPYYVYTKTVLSVFLVILGLYSNEMLCYRVCTMFLFYAFISYNFVGIAYIYKCISIKKCQSYLDKV